MLDKLQLFLILLIIPLGGIYWYTHIENISVREIFFSGTEVMQIGGMPLRVEIANSPEERAKGLSGRAALDKVNGLLFVFDKSDYHSMWMKDMRFPIDIIWISEDLKVISIDKNVSPDTYPRTFRPEKPARYAVETNALYTGTIGIATGQDVKLPPNYLED